MRIDPLLRELLDLPDEQRKIGAFFLVRALSTTSAPVWRAAQRYGGEHVRDAAVKLFSMRDASVGADVADRRRRQILAEVKKLCELHHSNIVQFRELVFDEARHVLGIGMEFVEGTSVAEKLERGPLSIPDTVSVGVAIATALAVVHRAELVHRDVKPANIVESKGVYKLINFGITAAEQLRVPAPVERRRIIVVDNLPTTVLGTRMGDLDGEMLRGDAATSSGRERDATDRPFAGLSGTVGYEDPTCVTQLIAETAASDLYALGATLFHCITGMVPAMFAEQGARLDGKVLEGTARAPTLATRLSAAPKELVALIDALLDPQREKRPASAESVKETLERIRAEAAKPPVPQPVSTPTPAARAVVAPTVAQKIVLPASNRTQAILPQHLVAGIVVLLVGGGGTYSFLSDRQTSREINDDWSKVSFCLVGDPLKAGETPSLRIHNMQLLADGAPTSKDPRQWGGEWPARCAPYARNLRARLEKANRANKFTHDLAWHLEPLAQMMENNTPSPSFVDEAWIEATKLALVAGAAPDVPPPPEPAHPLTLDALKEVTPLSTPKDGQIETSQGSASGTLTLLVRGAKPKLCTITETSARCAPLPKAIASAEQVRLVGDVENGADPLLLVDINEPDLYAQRVYRASGELVAEGRQIYGAVSRADGTITIASRDRDGKTMVMNQKRGEKASQAKTSWGDDAEYRWGLAFFHANKGEDHRLFSSDGGDAPRAIGKGIDTPHSLCKTAKGLLVYGTSAMTVYQDGVWSPPVDHKMGNGELSCFDAEAGPTGVFMRLDDNKLIEERCSKVGCGRVEGEFGPKGFKSFNVFGSFAGQAAIVWTTAGGGVKVRTAKLENLASAPTSVVFDGAVPGGADDGYGAVRRLRLFTKDRFAVLLITTSAGTYQFRLGTDGTITPLIPG